MSENSEIVHLSALKLAGTIPGAQSYSSASPTAPVSDLSSAWPVSIQPPPGFSHPKPQERLATDKIGEELAPDAGIWKIYLDEAKEQDDELVDSKNKNLDMMLLFATLYSAILSAFLIESKKLLQQDPTEVSNGLLLLIAQSQQRIEQGQPQPTLAPIQPVTFSAPSSARWINGLWFLSLALSLSAALVAMLAKEWLTAYNTSRPRSASTYAHLRQSRFNALFKWGALHIIDLLPSMLHLALLLFSIGLIIHLANLDGAVAIVIGVVTGGTFLFYVTAAFLGAIYEFCPFVTQISKYIEQILSFCFKSWMDKKGRSSEQDKRTSDSTTDEDIHALIWLAEHARDPAAGDCSYQALAGLHLTAPKYSTSAVSDTSSNQYELVHGLFQSLCTRLSQVLVQQPRELAACQGINVARYANALPKLVDFLEAYSSRPLTNKSKRSAKALLMPGVSAQTAFGALDAVWSDECPPLSPSSYALITSAELRLTVAASAPYFRYNLPHHTISDIASPGSPLRIHISPDNDDSPTESHVEVDMNRRETPLADSSVPLFDLQARYSRALSRAGYLLRYHADGVASINASALMHMLDSIREAAQHGILNPESQLSTHQPQSENGLPPTIGARIHGMGYTLYVGPSGIGDEDGLLVQFLRLAGSTQAQTTAGLEASLYRTFHAIAPVLLKQWLKLTASNGAHSEGEEIRFSKAQLASWPLIADSDNFNQATRLLTQQVMITAAISLSHIGRLGIDQLPDLAIVTLYKRLKNDPNPFLAHDTFARHLDQMSQLVPLVDQHLSKLDQTTLQAFVDIFLITYQNKTLFREPGIPPEHIPPFLRILAKVPGQATKLQTLLDVLVDRVEEYQRSQELFTHSGEGYNALLKIGENDEYRLVVAQSITEIIRSTAAWASGHPIEAQALSGFFNSVTFALKALPSDKERTAWLLSSTRKLMSLFGSLTDDELYAMATSPTTAILHHVLKTEVEQSEEQECLLAELEEIQCWSDIDDLPLRGLAFLSEQDISAL